MSLVSEIFVKIQIQFGIYKKINPIVQFKSVTLMHCTHECNVHKIFFLHSDLEFENLSINCYFLGHNTYLIPYKILTVSYYWTIFWIWITVRCFRAQPFQNKILCNNRNWKLLWLCIEIKLLFKKRNYNHQQYNKNPIFLMKI